MLIGAEVILAVRDVPASIRFYRDVLGFESDWTWGDDANFGGVQWGSVHIMLSKSLDVPCGTSMFLSVRDVDELFERHLSAGVVDQPIENKPWGRREYVVRDPDGHHLRIAGRIPGTSQGSAPLPDEVVFEERIVTTEEFAHLRQSVGWGPSGNADLILEKTWGGVVATVGGKVVGMTRITMDSEGWFGLWDVIVNPEWQGRRIGETMMNRSLEMVHRTSPGAFVVLFTFRDEFYEKLGFRQMDAMARKV